jgi:hypothetical protein
MKRHILVTETWQGIKSKSFIDETAAVTAFMEANGYDEDFEWYLKLFLNRGFLFGNKQADLPTQLITTEIY